MKKKLNLLGELIEDFDGVKTQANLIKKLADYMYRNFKCAAVELAWELEASTTVLNVTRESDSYNFKSTGRDLNQSAFSEVLASGQALVSEVQEETDDNLFIEERIAIELYATQLVILPLYDKDDINGFLSFYLLEEQDLASLSELLQHMLTTVTVTIKQISLIEKLTGICRKSYKKANEYKAQIEDIKWQGEETECGVTRQDLLRDCRLAATSKTTVYINGELGTNKEEIAKTIHRVRTFGKEVFIEFDCAKLNDEKQTEVLFGTQFKKGSLGYWDRAGKGTLYISHAEDMHPEGQQILLELQERTGPDTPQIIVSGELQKAVNDGDFDSDIYEEISSMTINAPALRTIREDILSISQSYLKKLAKKLNLPQPKIDRKFTQTILAAEWKGNHKELKEFLEEALIKSPDKNLIIPESYLKEGGVTLRKTSASLDNSIKKNIVDALKRTRGKVYGEDGAAVLLGLNPSTLQSKIRKFGIQKKSYKKS